MMAKRKPPRRFLPANARKLSAQGERPLAPPGLVWYAIAGYRKAAVAGADGRPAAVFTECDVPMVQAVPWPYVWARIAVSSAAPTSGRLPSLTMVSALSGTT